MKVIHQLADYLRRTGALSDVQFAWLDEHGFIYHSPLPSEDDLPPEADEEPKAEPETSLSPEEREDPGVLGLERPRPRRGRGSRPPPRPEPSPRQVAATVRGLLDGYAPATAVLTALAERRGVCADGPEATRRLMNLAPADLDALLAEALRARSPSFLQLWDVLALDPTQALAAACEGPGQTARGLSRILGGFPREELGKAGRLFKHEPFCRLHELTRAQRALAMSFDRLNTSDPALVALCLRRDHHPLGYAVLTLVHTARRHLADPTRPLPLRAGEHVPARLPHRTAAPPLAWAWAGQIEPRLVEVFAQLADASDRSANERLWAQLLQAPEEAAADFDPTLRHWFAWLKNRIAGGNAPARPEVYRHCTTVLTRILSVQRARIPEDPLWGPIAAGADDWVWEIFFDTWWRRYLSLHGAAPLPAPDPEFAELVQACFPSSNSLRCPARWDS